ncbi:hypothetical protein, partial [Escherichia coli]|uniref:hypothetical protein n=1 Tax=Escherichia coli TaxID=562 RepID=UPI001954F85C
AFLSSIALAMGSVMIMVMQPEGTPMAETMANVGDVERYLAEHEPVAHAYAVGGFSLYGFLE